MGEVVGGIDDRLREFIAAQRMFFVATAPRDEAGHLNISPKGLDTLRVMDAHTVAYLDYVGSGAETIAHLRENGRIVLMFCAFQGPPNILRIYGRGEVVEPQDHAFESLCAMFPAAPARAIIRIAIERVSTTCGFGVPLFSFEGDRKQLVEWSKRKGEDGLRRYQQEKNATSIDGLPALRWTESAE
jgi:hypothetical protein